MIEVSGVPPMPAPVEQMPEQEMMEQRRDYWATRRDMAHLALLLAQREVGRATIQLAGTTDALKPVFYDPYIYEGE